MFTNGDINKPAKMRQKADNDQFFDQLQRIITIKTIIIDSSSLIYLNKLDLLKLLCQEIHTLTIAEVAQEVGPDLITNSNIRLLPPLTSVSRYPTASTDQKLVLQAVSGKYCMVADDRRILRACLESKLQAHAAIIMIALLYFLSRISLAQFRDYRDQLADFARYDPALLAYADELCFMFGKYY